MRSRVLPSMCLAAASLPVLLLVAATGGEARAATALADASARCLPVQYREGAAAYRDCVADAADDPAVSAVDALSFDERYALEQICSDAGDPGDCADAQLASLDDAPAPFLGALDADDRNAVLRQCFAVQGRDGVAAWRRCLSDALAAVEALPGLELAALSLSERGALALRCAADEGTAADYRRCRLEALGIPFEEATVDTALVEPAETRGRAGEAADVNGGSIEAAPPADTAGSDADADGGGGGDAVGENAVDESVRAESPSDTRRVTLPADPAFPVDPVDPVDPASDDADRIAADGSAADEPVVTARDVPAAGAAEPLDDPADASSPDLRQRMGDARDRLTATVTGLDGTERIVLFAALALPLLLLGLWAIGRGTGSRRSEALEPDVPLRNTALVGRLAPSMQRTGGAGFHEEFDDETSDEDFFADIGRTADTDTDDTLRGEPGHDRTAFVAPDDSGAFEKEITPRSAFGRWLLAREAPLRRQHAIEFLIYWMAYGDERYEPALAEALLRDGGDDGDPHDLIKRHVLEEDTAAFADVVRWVQAHCGELERVQIIDLLIVLLVGDGAMTPVQNTLLHFLADALGLGADGLGQRHEEAFGQPMPALARVDLDVWWERVEPTRLPRWDARSVAALDEHAQHRIRLDLPPDGELDEPGIVEAFRRAARRCQPHRFDALGDRERALAERQFAKFEEARDRLLGVIA